MGSLLASVPGLRRHSHKGQQSNNGSCDPRPPGACHRRDCVPPQLWEESFSPWLLHLPTALRYPRADRMSNSQANRGAGARGRAECRTPDQLLEAAVIATAKLGHR